MVSKSPFEVIAENLLELDGAFACLPLEPRSMAFVQRDPRFLGDRLVCSVANQEMAESEGTLTGEDGPVVADEAPLSERE